MLQRFSPMGTYLMTGLMPSASINPQGTSICHDDAAYKGVYNNHVELISLADGISKPTAADNFLCFLAMVNYLATPAGEATT